MIRRRLLGNGEDPQKQRPERTRAARLLGERRISAAVPALIEALSTRGLQDAACRALGELGPEAAAAIPALEALKTSDRFVGQSVTHALLRIRDASPRPVE